MTNLSTNFLVATFLPKDKKKDELQNLEAQMITHVALRYSDLQKKFAQSTLIETRGKFADEIAKANHLEGEEKDIELARINGLVMEYGMERFKELNPGFVPTQANFFESPTMNSAAVVAATPVQAASAGDSSKGSSSKGASMNGVETGWEDETGGMGKTWMATVVTVTKTKREIKTKMGTTTKRETTKKGGMTERIVSSGPGSR